MREKYNLSTLLKCSSAFTLMSDAGISFLSACPLWLSAFWAVAFWYIVLVLQLCQACFSLEGYSLLSNMILAFHRYLPNLIVNNDLKIISVILYDLFTIISESTELHLTFSNVCTGWSRFWVVGPQFDSLRS